MQFGHKMIGSAFHYSFMWNSFLFVCWVFINKLWKRKKKRKYLYYLYAFVHFVCQVQNAITESSSMFTFFSLFVSFQSIHFLKCDFLRKKNELKGTKLKLKVPIKSKKNINFYDLWYKSEEAVMEATNNAHFKRDNLDKSLFDVSHLEKKNYGHFFLSLILRLDSQNIYSDKSYNKTKIERNISLDEKEEK